MFLFDMFRLSAGAAFSFFATLLLMIFKPFSSKLCGRDRGKVYVPGSQINIGKYTGVGFYFTAVFITASLVFACRNWTCFFPLRSTEYPLHSQVPKSAGSDHRSNRKQPLLHCSDGWTISPRNLGVNILKVLWMHLLQ